MRIRMTYLLTGKCIVWYNDLSTSQTDLERGYTWARQDLIDEMWSTATNFLTTPTTIAANIPSEGD
jgi:hypothetical protein